MVKYLPRLLISQGAKVFIEEIWLAIFSMFVFLCLLFSHGVTLFFLTRYTIRTSLWVYISRVQKQSNHFMKRTWSLFFYKDRLSGTCSGRLPPYLTRYAAYYWRGSCCCLYLSTNYMEIWMLPTTKHQSCDEGNGNTVLLLMVSPGTKSGTVLLLIWRNGNASDLVLALNLVLFCYWYENASDLLTTKKSKDKGKELGNATDLQWGDNNATDLQRGDKNATVECYRSAMRTQEKQLRNATDLEWVLVTYY